MTRLRPTAVFKVKKVSAYQWDMRDRSFGKAVLEYRVEYYVATRTFECGVRVRQTKKGRWSSWAPATPEQREKALAAIGEAEVARCMADSLLRRPA